MKHQFINGWNKHSVMLQITRFNNNTKSGSLVNDIFNCQYKDSNHNHCAIGCFIPNDHEGLQCNGDVYILISTFEDLGEKMPFEGDSLTHFQQVHDNSKHHDVWKNIYEFLENHCE